MGTSTRRGNKVSAGNTDVRRVNAQREQGWRARLIDTATEKLRRKERVGGRKREREREPRGKWKRVRRVSKSRYVGMAESKLLDHSGKDATSWVRRSEIAGPNPVGPQQQLSIWLMCFSIQKIGRFRRPYAVCCSLVWTRYTELIKFALQTRHPRSALDREFINRSLFSRSSPKINV